MVGPCRPPSEWADDLCYSVAALVPADRAASDACNSTAECRDFKQCMAPYGGFFTSQRSPEFWIRHSR